MIGTILRGYRVVEKIKDGSVGTVWKAVGGDNRPYAIKQIAEKHASNGRKLRQFRREARLTRSLSHRNIIKVHEYVPARPLPYFIMELFESENLKYAMWYQPDRVYSHEFYILRQLAEALAFIHARGIVHRDVKPENVLVNREAEVRLIDFSLAQNKWNRLLQFERRIEGTPLYMSPEQIRGEKCDARSDVYSFGVLMFELLTKRPPYIGTTEAAVLKKHINEPLPSMKYVVGTLSSDLDAFVQKMLAKRREDRFQEMTQILLELGKWERKDTKIRVRQVEPARRAPSGPGSPDPGARP